MAVTSLANHGQVLEEHCKDNITHFYWEEGEVGVGEVEVVEGIIEIRHLLQRKY